LSLTQCFVKQHACGDRNVQAIDNALHWQLDRLDIRCVPCGGEAFGFASQDDGGAVSEICLVIPLGGVHAGGEDGQLLSPQPRDGFGTCGGTNRHREDGSQARANGVRVVEVGAAIGNDQRVDACAVGTAQHRADVARFFDPFEHGDGGVWRKC
jgi:hypothetical protein